NINYGAGSGGSGGLLAGWTMGMYYALGNVTGSVASDPTGIADPSTLGGGLQLASGAGSTAAFQTSAFGAAGQAQAAFFYAVPGSLSAGGQIVTLIVTAYNGASYLASFDRGHSIAFILTTSANTSPSPTVTGSAMPTFSALPVPEPTTLALAGLGGLGLLLFRRKQA
ncbi:MAG: PEP-CTERM sorting domain-containing protein, partial [Verrucomicrobiia bacterium]